MSWIAMKNLFTSIEIFRYSERYKIINSQGIQLVNRLNFHNFDLKNYCL